MLGSQISPYFTALIASCLLFKIVSTSTRARTQSSCTFSELVIAFANPVITINVPVVFMARYVMVLRGATSLRGALEGVGPENRDFFGP